MQYNHICIPIELHFSAVMTIQSWCMNHGFKSLAIRLFIQQLFQDNIKENIKDCITGHPHSFFPSQMASNAEIVSMS